MKIIDTHLHVWNLNQFSLPWLEGLGEPLEKSYSEEDYRKELLEEPEYQVEKAVYIEVDVAADQKERETEFLLEQCGNKGSIIAAGVISGNVSDPNFPQYLDRYKGSAIRGIRQVLHTDQSPTGFCLRPDFIRGIKELGARGLVFEACMRTAELGDLYTLAQICAQTTIIMDHMGNIDAQLIGNGQLGDEWLSNVHMLAKLPNVVCKISGLNPSGGWDAQMLKPAVDAALDAFGEDRVIYASNYPVCKGYTDMLPWIKALDEITAERGSLFRNKLFYENAIKIYHL